MNFTPFQFTQILPDLFVYCGAVNTGVLRRGKRAILVDPDDTLTPERLLEIGIHTVERIYCTQHRRPNTAGIEHFQRTGQDKTGSVVFAPQGERLQFEAASAHWQSWHNRWHLYHFRPGPLAPLADIPLAGMVGEGDRFEWGGFTISVLDTPGMTDGAVSYLVELEDETGKPQRVIFSGDALYGHGQLWDVHSLQKKMGAWSDYHGFLGAAQELTASLVKLECTPADFLVPAHGGLVLDHAAAARLAVQRLERLYRNYAAVSSLNFYFPEIFDELADDPMRMAPAETVPFPDFIRFVSATSFAILSESGALFLVDCGHDSVLETLIKWKEQGIYTELEGCWVTHYHDDHVDSLHHLASASSVPIIADEYMVEILTHPTRFCLPCISPTITPVARATTHGETWRWHEFELTALHFPGQSFYHGGLLARGHGMAVLFSGDSFSPCGMDDYTAGNRNFLGAGLGFRRCIDLVRQHQPDLILNQHQQQAFRFSDEQLDFMERNLVERETILRELLPWDNPNFGTDEGWVRAYPYQVEGVPGGTFTVEVRATNHSGRPCTLAVEAVLPAGWTSQSRGSFSSQSSVEWIEHAPLEITVPPGTPSGTYPLAFRVTWEGRYLGQVCRCLVEVG